jgi:hypothetical protein
MAGRVLHQGRQRKAELGKQPLQALDFIGPLSLLKFQQVAVQRGSSLQTVPRIFTAVKCIQRTWIRFLPAPEMIYQAVSDQGLRINAYFGRFISRFLPWQKIV